MLIIFNAKHIFLLGDLQVATNQEYFGHRHIFNNLKILSYS
jgi:hypothetical protein